ncbi:neutral zinc metallopeptidase [Mycolicibacterium aichiense]|uniref:Aminopeptidase n=1 Tax=Mycolicibacterium aichiense TaxID=1799 RepID=A0AAD1MAV5_9MYCO|nr:neutral zinc metallopeptidase [Mycolicibacterium aichiense]MCV7019768.1 neutral zinc metallopeptidase [Mycolicibacterium aichiense]BBX06858.1 aminopeptidase [Mycolicibacterium aichiense]STZ80674.1 putative metalloprotease [Mycolicibacterium aichiense]
MRSKALILAALAIVLAACGGPKPDKPQSLAQNTQVANTAPEAIKITGDASTGPNKIAVQAIADLQKYWSVEYPKLYGSEYTPVEGGFFSVIPSSGELPPCAEAASDIAGNAFYCASKDVVAWDSETLLPELQSKFGDFVIPIVLAHEWGHAIQARSNFTARTVTKELQADCFAGGWAKHAKDSGLYKVNAADMDNALAGILELRDSPGTSKIDPSAHGSGFDRVGAFQDGYDNGPTACKAYRDDNPVVVELPFQNAEDEAAGGDMPYDAMVNDVPYDIEDYWAHVYPELTNGEAWVPVKGLEPFDPSNPPMCGNTRADGYALFYCVPDDYIGWENDAMRTVYNQGGDYAVATLIATQFGLAAMTRANDKSDDKTQSLRGDCFAGSYTASVLLQNRKETSSFGISPGDLDEAITALLVFRGDGDVDRQGAGYERIRHFRTGVLDGAGACLKD